MRLSRTEKLLARLLVRVSRHEIATQAFENEITVMVAAKMLGTEKLPLLIIGKSKQTRYFGKKGVGSLPVTYTFNKKSWMNSPIYEELSMKTGKKKLDARFIRKEEKFCC